MQSDGKDTDLFLRVIVSAVQAIAVLIHIGLILIFCFAIAFVVIRCVNFSKQVRRRRKKKAAIFYADQDGHILHA